MADDLFQSSMAGAQQVPANFNAQEADNFEDVSALPYTPNSLALSGDYFTDPMLLD